MMTPNNRKVITRLSLRSLRAAPMRNLAVICATVLTTLLITSIFTMVMSINKSMELAQMKTAGGDFHGSFKYLTREQVETLKAHPSIRESAISLQTGRLSNAVFTQSPVEVLQIDESYARHGFVNFVEGGLPAREEEVVLSTWVLDKLEIPHKLGERVPLKIDIGGQVITGDFILSGYYEADKNLAMAGLAFVSKAFTDKNLAGLDPVLSKDSGSYVNTYVLSVMFSSSVNIENKIRKVLADTGLDVDYGVNWAYTATTLADNPLSVLPYLAVVVVIMFSGYLLIYNIFYISVVRDVKFYGLLKAIGTTPRQLRRVITAQAKLLYLAALPVGLGSGYAVGRLLVPMLNSFSGETMESAYSASPWIFVFAALFSYLTVRIAASKPGRMAARIAPVEAVKYAGINAGARKLKRSKRGARLYSMAFTNILRQPKKLVLMITSLALSVVLFGIIFTLISSLDVNKYLNSYIAGDLVIRNKPNLVHVEGERPGDAYQLSEKFLPVLGSLDGVERVDNVFYKTELYPPDEAMLAALKKDDKSRTSWKWESNPILLNLYGIDAGWYDHVPQDIIEGTFDRTKFDTGNYVLVSEAIFSPEDYQTYYHPGDKITYKGLGKSYEVMAVVKSGALEAAVMQMSFAFGYNAFLPAAELTKALPAGSEPAMALSSTLQVNPDKLESVEQVLKSLTAAADELTVKSREDYRQELGRFIRVIQTLGYGLSFVIALIGILNYVNTVVTGVINRKHEFALLESVGMTRKQLKRVLVYEGLYNALCVTAVISTAGALLTYTVARSVAANIVFTNFRMNWLPFILTVPILLVIAYAVTVSSYRMLAKNTLVERLRQPE
ncbi:ABC transporter permease [Paenibacillus tepidiphilus]|uniref:ABC transporter permease n=1 Tax=Paenibacillus tepidiphilus TaxID=2608683 RepID=UPI00193EC0EC|nr:FtsX-like permease family protein [Paenibacillus tepidiphilus]